MRRKVAVAGAGTEPPACASATIVAGASCSPRVLFLSLELADSLFSGNGVYARTLVQALLHTLPHANVLALCGRPPTRSSEDGIGDARHPNRSPQMNSMTRNTSAGTVATIAAAAMLPGAPAEVAARLQVRAAALRHWGALDRSSDWQGFAAAAHEARTSCRKFTHVLFENNRSVLAHIFFAVRCCFAAPTAEGSERAIGSSRPHILAHNRALIHFRADVAAFAPTHLLYVDWTGALLAKALFSTTLPHARDSSGKLPPAMVYLNFRIFSANQMVAASSADVGSSGSAISAEGLRSKSSSSSSRDSRYSSDISDSRSDRPGVCAESDVAFYRRHEAAAVAAADVYVAACPADAAALDRLCLETAN